MTTTEPRAVSAADNAATPRASTVLRIRGRVRLCTDTTLGSSTSDHSADTRIARDTATGRPLWAGTGQAGALRHHLAAVLGDTHADKIFGTGDTDSAVRTTDALAYRTDGGYPTTSLRTGNRIDTATGIVDPGAVFTDEVLPAGTVFLVDWSLHAPSAQLTDLTAALVRAVDGLDDDSIRLGARAGKGRGETRASHWQVELHELGTATGFEAWYTRERAPRWPTPDEKVEGGDDLAACLDIVLPGVADRVAALRTIDQRTRIVVTASLAVAETVFIGTDAHGPRETTRPATMVQGTGGGDDGDRGPLARSPLTRPIGRGGDESPIDSGSAVHSMLKRHGRWILHALANRADSPDAAAHADAIADDLFGSSTRGNLSPRRLRSSRVTVTESPIHGTATAQLPHVRLNPLTQGAVDNHLFFEDVLVGGTSTITITIARASLPDLGLLDWILRDLTHGAGPAMGAATTNGHGRRVLTAAEFDIPADLYDGHPDGWHAESLSSYFGSGTALREAAHCALDTAIAEGLS